MDTCGKHTLSYARARLENIQRVTQGYVWKIYSELREDTCGKHIELRKDTLRKYTASYAWIREENIQRVTQGQVWKTH